jgi:hypothetical protein
MKEVQKLWQIILISVLCFVLSSVSLSCIRIVRLSEEDSIASTSQAQQVSDQERLIAAIGYPDEFTIIFDEGQDNLRVEMWLYADLERYFTFTEGEYTGGDTVITPILAADDFKITPDDFDYGMSRQNIAKLMGEQGISIVGKNSGYTAVSFKQGRLSCMFNEMDQLVTVLKTRAVSGSN